MKIGDKVIILRNYREWSEENIKKAFNIAREEVTVVKISRIYVTVRSNSGLQHRFRKPIGIDHYGFYYEEKNDSSLRMYETLDDIANQIQLERLRKIMYHRDIMHLSYEDLLKVKEITDKYM